MKIRIASQGLNRKKKKDGNRDSALGQLTVKKIQSRRSHFFKGKKKEIKQEKKIRWANFTRWRDICYQITEALWTKPK